MKQLSITFIEFGILGCSLCSDPVTVLGETDFSWAILGMYYVYWLRLYNNPVAFDLVPIPIEGLLLYLHQLKQKLLRRRLLDLLVPGSFPDQFYRV